MQKSLDKITLVIVKNNQFSLEDEALIKQEINRYSHNELDIEFDFVANIALTPSGKHRVTISQLDK